MVIAFALTACGGDSKSSSETPKATDPPVVTTVAPDTTPPAPPTTVEATTTTAPIDYSYTIDTSGFIYDNDGQYFGPIPAEPGVAFDSVHPGHEDEGAVPLRDVANLDLGSEVCFHSPGGNETMRTLQVQIFSKLDPSTGETTTVLEVTYSDSVGDGWIDFAEELGMSPYPDGTWKEGSYVTIGSCT